MGKALEEYIEHDLKPSGARCFVDRLRKDVKPSLNALRNAGSKIWMPTCDKVGKERCVAVSARLVSGEKYVHTIAKCMPTPLFFYIQIILTPVRLCSKTKKLSV